jgi:hypothetical protein
MEAIIVLEQHRARMTPGRKRNQHIPKILGGNAHSQTSSNQNLRVRIRVLKRTKVAMMAIPTKVIDTTRFVVLDG